MPRAMILRWTTSTALSYLKTTEYASVFSTQARRASSAYVHLKAAEAIAVQPDRIYSWIDCK